MAYYRRYRKRTYRKRTWRRNFKSKMTRRKIIKPKFGGRVQQPVHYFTRFVNKSSISIPSGSSSHFGTIHFKLNDVPAFSEFKAIYDFFKIKAVKIVFQPASNVSLGSSTALQQQTTFFNKIYTVFDYNDKSVPSSVNDLRQYQNCRWSPGSTTHKRFIYPKVLVTVDEDGPGVGTYAASSFGKNPWISTDNDACEYYGIKYGIQTTLLSQDTAMYEVECKYYLAFKSRK